MSLRAVEKALPECRKCGLRSGEKWNAVFPGGRAAFSCLPLAPVQQVLARLRFTSSQSDGPVVDFSPRLWSLASD